MKKLISYIEKNIVPGMEYRPATCGNDYFEGIPAPVYTTLYFALDYTTSPDEILAMSRAESKIEKYCNRYDYDIYNYSGAPGYRWFTIAKHEDRETYEYYQTYVNASVNECEQLRHDKGFYPGIGYDMQKIMEEHEQGYKEFLKAIAAA